MEFKIINKKRLRKDIKHTYVAVDSISLEDTFLKIGEQNIPWEYVQQMDVFVDGYNLQHMENLGGVPYYNRGTSNMFIMTICDELMRYHFKISDLAEYDAIMSFLQRFVANRIKMRLFLRGVRMN